MKFILQYIAFVLFIFIPFEVDSKEFGYVNIRDPNLTIRLTTNPVKAVFGEHAMVTTLCNSGESLYCVDSNVFVFGVPNSKEGEVNENWKFKKSKPNEYLMFGEIQRLIKIDFFDEEENLISYWFSEEKGIQWIYMKIQDDVAFFMSQRFCGFGASEECQSIEH